MGSTHCSVADCSTPFLGTSGPYRGHRGIHTLVVNFGYYNFNIISFDKKCINKGLFRAAVSTWNWIINYYNFVFNITYN
jgi:hypothetical protein